MKKITTICTMLLFVYTANSQGRFFADNQGSFFIGENSYPCSGELYFSYPCNEIRGTMRTLYVRFIRDGSVGMIALSVSARSSMERIAGKILVYLEDGTVITSFGGNKFDFVNNKATTIYRFPTDHIKKMRNSNISQIRFSNFLASDRFPRTANLIKELFDYSWEFAVLSNCDARTPGWGNNLGTITRGAERTISGNGITQIWSDAVTATACNKSCFWSGIPALSSADCRSNSGYPGDLVSWCAVVMYQYVLCPYPWRVPTSQDFIDLNIALGGIGNNRTDRDRYLNNWGGAYGGRVFSRAIFDAQIDGQGWQAYYWSQTELDKYSGFSLHFSSRGDFATHDLANKSRGHTLRCIRDY